MWFDHVSIIESVDYTIQVDWNVNWGDFWDGGEEGARVVELAYVMVVYARVYCVNTLDGLQVTWLKYGTDFNQFTMLLLEHG